MKTRKILDCIFKKEKKETPQVVQSGDGYHPVCISEFNNVWNQLVLELARPKLNPDWKTDEEKVRGLRRRLITLKPNNPSAYCA